MRSRLGTDAKACPVLLFRPGLFLLAACFSCLQIFSASRTQTFSSFVPIDFVVVFPFTFILSLRLPCDALALRVGRRRNLITLIISLVSCLLHFRCKSFHQLPNKNSPASTITISDTATIFITALLRVSSMTPTTLTSLHDS